jgi:hypothetical protein
MSERTNKDIEIKDLPPEETLTPEEKERLAGAGRFRPTVEALEARAMMDATGLGNALSSGQGPPAGTAQVRNQQIQIVPMFVQQTMALGSQNNLQTTNLQQDTQKAIKEGPMELRTGPVGAEPRSQRQQEREALDRMLALPVTRPPAGDVQPQEIRARFLTGSEPGSKPATPPQGWRKIEVFGPPEAGSTIAVKKGTFFQDPATGRMIRWS